MNLSNQLARKKTIDQSGDLQELSGWRQTTSPRVQVPALQLGSIKPPEVNKRSDINVAGRFPNEIVPKRKSSFSILQRKWITSRGQMTSPEPSSTTRRISKFKPNLNGVLSPSTSLSQVSKQIQNRRQLNTSRSRRQTQTGRNNETTEIHRIPTGHNIIKTKTESELRPLYSWKSEFNSPTSKRSNQNSPRGFGNGLDGVMQFRVQPKNQLLHQKSRLQSTIQESKISQICLPDERFVNNEQKFDHHIDMACSASPPGSKKTIHSTFFPQSIIFPQSNPEAMYKAQQDGSRPLSAFHENIKSAGSVGSWKQADSQQLDEKQDIRKIKPKAKTTQVSKESENRKKIYKKLFTSKRKHKRRLSEPKPEIKTEEAPKMTMLQIVIRAIIMKEILTEEEADQFVQDKINLLQKHERKSIQSFESWEKSQENSQLDIPEDIIKPKTIQNYKFSESQAQNAILPQEQSLQAKEGWPKFLRRFKPKAKTDVFHLKQKEEPEELRIVAYRDLNRRQSVSGALEANHYGIKANEPDELANENSPRKEIKVELNHPPERRQMRRRSAVFQSPKGFLDDSYSQDSEENKNDYPEFNFYDLADIKLEKSDIIILNKAHDKKIIDDLQNESFERPPWQKPTSPSLKYPELPNSGQDSRLLSTLPIDPSIPTSPTAATKHLSFTSLEDPTMLHSPTDFLSPQEQSVQEDISAWQYVTQATPAEWDDANFQPIKYYTDFKVKISSPKTEENSVEQVPTISEPKSKRKHKIRQQPLNPKVSKNAQNRKLSETKGAAPNKKTPKGEREKVNPQPGSKLRRNPSKISKTKKGNTLHPNTKHSKKSTRTSVNWKSEKKVQEKQKSSESSLVSFTQSETEEDSISESSSDAGLPDRRLRERRGSILNLDYQAGRSWNSTSILFQVSRHLSKLTTQTASSEQKNEDISSPQPKSQVHFRESIREPTIIPEEPRIRTPRTYEQYAEEMLEGCKDIENEDIDEVLSTLNKAQSDQELNIAFGPKMSYHFRKRTTSDHGPKIVMSEIPVDCDLNQMGVLMRKNRYYASKSSENLKMKKYQKLQIAETSSLHPAEFAQKCFEDAQKRRYRNKVMAEREKNPHVTKIEGPRPRKTFSGLNDIFVKSKIGSNKKMRRSVYNSPISLKAQTSRDRVSQEFEGKAALPGTLEYDERVYRRLWNENEDIFKVKAKYRGIADKYLLSPRMGLKSNR